MDRKVRRKPIPASLRRALASLGEEVATWRKLRGLTQDQLADRSDISRSTLKRLEQGDGGVSTENLLRVLRSLGILELFSRALDPYESDIGRLRSDRQLPERVRPRSLSERRDG
jgi:transcriptional regulator with XRE-family HTH domain